MNEHPHPLLLVQEQMGLVPRGRVEQAQLSSQVRESLRRA